MAEELRDTIVRIKPLADAVSDAASALNAAIGAAVAEGLSVRIDVLENPAADGETHPNVRVRVSKRIV